MYRLFKIVVLLFAVISVTSCLQVSEYYDETFPSFEELRLFTAANQTKAIAESTTVPTDNVITMFTNFHSEGDAVYPEYNVLKLFGYDDGKEVWRSAVLENPALFEQPHYQFNPFNWPGGDKVFLDYIAISNNCRLSESEVSPQIVDANRLNVGYESVLPAIMEDRGPLPGSDLLAMLLDYCDFKGIGGILKNGETKEAFLAGYEEACTAIENGGETEGFKDIVNRACWLNMNYSPALFKYMQDDLLYAYGRNVRNENGGAIKATFDHAKSWIKVVINNKTDYDLYVSDITFTDIKTGGILNLDNSKALFDVYWDLTEPESATKKKSVHRAGLVPDAFFVPAGCFGPAERVGRWSDVSGLRGLECEYVRSDIDDGRELALSGKLSGAMFPNQEPGVIDISYLMWPHSEEGFDEKEQSNIQKIEMGQTLRYLKNELTAENERHISLNLPRKYWKMGKVYIYLITISENEITIDPTEEEWDPVVGPTGDPEKQSGGTGRYEFDNPSWFSTDNINTIAGVNAALANGTTSIEINDDPEDAETAVILPSAINGKNVSLNITGVSGKNLSFKCGETAQGPANLFITTNAQSLDIDCPNTHVEVNGGSYEQIAATTSSTTLSVGRNVTVETLNIRGGNVEIHGTVTNVLRAGANKVTWYADTPERLSAGLGKAAAGDDIYITEPGEYTVETLSLPTGCTLEAKVGGVVLVHTPASTSWVANCGDNTTVKNLTWNVGTANHQYFHGVNLVGCKVNGLLCTHSNNTYTDCEFYNADNYNLWEYGSGSTFVRCKFTCPGRAHGEGGGAVNAYNEGQQGMKTVIFEDCQFYALATSDYYSAVYIKPETDFDIRFTRCTADEKFCTGANSNSRLWNVKDHSNKNTKVTVDGTLVYSNGALTN